MAHRVIWSLTAERDLRSVVRYISKDSPQRAEAFGYRIIARVEMLCEHPHLGRELPEFARPELRELIVSPYRVVYRFFSNSRWPHPPATSYPQQKTLPRGRLLRLADRDPSEASTGDMRYADVERETSDSIHREVRQLAKEDGVSINQFISLALAEKVSSLRTVDYLKQRTVLSILDSTPDVKPERQRQKRRD